MQQPNQNLGMQTMIPPQQQQMEKIDNISKVKSLVGPLRGDNFVDAERFVDEFIYFSRLFEERF